MDPVGFEAILDALPDLHPRPFGGILIGTVDALCTAKQVRVSRSLIACS